MSLFSLGVKFMVAAATLAAAFAAGQHAATVAANGQALGDAVTDLKAEMDGIKTDVDGIKAKQLQDEDAAAVGNAFLAGVTGGEAPTGGTTDDTTTGNGSAGDAGAVGGASA